MKIAILATALLCVASTSHSQSGGQLKLSGDEFGVSCAINDNGGEVNVYIFHVGFENVVALQFGAPRPDCWVGATWVADVSTLWTIGGTQEAIGWVVHYNGCVSGARYLGKMVFLTSGETVSCCAYPALKADDLHPEFPGPIAADCDEGLVGVDAGYGGIINADDTCPCSFPVPTEETTWGRVKSLYR